MYSMEQPGEEHPAAGEQVTAFDPATDDFDTYFDRCCRHMAIDFKIAGGGNFADTYLECW